MPEWSLFVELNGERHEYAIGPETRVGRGGDCQVRLSHPKLSRHHFTVRRTDSGALLDHAHKKDQNPDGSWVTMHSYVNGERVMDTAPLSPGDRISIEPGQSPGGPVIEVGESRNPKPPEEKKPWWKPW